MKIKNLLFIILILLLILIRGSFKKTTSFNNPKPITINVKEKDGVVNLDLEEYIVGVLAAEMPASFSVEALKAQAVAARSYAIYKIKNSKGDYDVINSVANQKFDNISFMKDKWKDNYEFYYHKLLGVVNDTKGEVLTYNDEIIPAYYFAMSNGVTENVQNVFKEERPYLKSVDSSWDKNVNNFEVINKFSIDDFCKKLKIKKPIIQSIKKNETNHIAMIVIDNKSFTGVDFRKILNLRSTDFQIDVVGDDVLITTKGYGHGVGMSQYGANEMAKIGYSYKEILNYYYQNIEIVNYYV